MPGRYTAKPRGRNTRTTIVYRVNSSNPLVKFIKPVSQFPIKYSLETTLENPVREYLPSSTIKTCKWDWSTRKCCDEILETSFPQEYSKSKRLLSKYTHQYLICFSCIEMANLLGNLCVE